MNYATGQPEAIGWGLMEDSLNYEDEPAATQPTLIFHGLQDDVVPVGVSRAYARTRTSARLVEVESDHELLSAVDVIWEGTRAFLCGGEDC